MEKKTNILLYFFIFVALVTFVGFFNTYLKFFPNFDKFPFVIHFHFLAFTIWLLMLIVQPLLIKKKKTNLHRKIGRLSYFIAPVLLITIIILFYHEVKREIQLPNNNAPLIAFIGLIDIATFSSFYVIAMVKRKNIRWHIAFLIATTLVVLNPGLSRLLNRIQFGLGMLVAVLLPFIVTLLIIFIEKIKYNRPILKNPYFLYFCIWAVIVLLLFTIPTTELWMNFISATFI